MKLFANAEKCKSFTCLFPELIMLVFVVGAWDMWKSVLGGQNDPIFGESRHYPAHPFRFFRAVFPQSNCE